jgi:hypothetical protein
MSRQLLDPKDPSPGNNAASKARRNALGVGVGGLGVGTFVAAATSSMPLWLGIALAALALALLVMAAIILFGKRDDPTHRLIKIIRACR